jgi:hypothetical protein
MSKLCSTEFTFNDKVRSVLTNENGIVTAIHYESPNFYTYAVLFATGPQRAIEAELRINEEIDY